MLAIYDFCVALTSGQSYKASASVNYDSIFVNISNLLVITTLE